MTATGTSAQRPDANIDISGQGPMVTGSASSDEKTSSGAPVGLPQSADGALLIADDVGNALWSVTAGQ